MCQVEHGVVQGVETSQRDELELIAHCSELFLELRNSGIIQVLTPVEGRGAVIGQ